MRSGRGFGAVGLVAAVLDSFEGLGLDVELLNVLELASELVAVDRGPDVVDGCEVFGGEVLAQLVDHVDEDIGGGGGDAGARGHGPLALHGVVGAEDEGHGIEQVDGRLFGVRTCQVKDGSPLRAGRSLRDFLRFAWASRWSAWDALATNGSIERSVYESRSDRGPRRAPSPLLYKINMQSP